jgi:hypothetical protein
MRVGQDPGEINTLKRLNPHTVGGAPDDRPEAVPLQTVDVSWGVPVDVGLSRAALSRVSESGLWRDLSCQRRRSSAGWRRRGFGLFNLYRVLTSFVREF